MANMTILANMANMAYNSSLLAYIGQKVAKTSNVGHVGQGVGQRW